MLKSSEMSLSAAEVSSSAIENRWASGVLTGRHDFVLRATA